MSYNRLEIQSHWQTLLSKGVSSHFENKDHPQESEEEVQVNRYQKWILGSLKGCMFYLYGSSPFNLAIHCGN